MFEKTQQKLGRRNTCTPTDTSHIRGIVAGSLNREETLGVAGLKTLPTNLDGNLQSGMTGQGLRVPVLNMHGRSLMPTRSRKARVLVKQGKAKVVKRTPFVIQLTYTTGEATQNITLGIDSGYTHIGCSITTETEELFSSDFELRKDVSKKLQERSMYRRNRRGRLWHRKSRFNNRTRPEGWLPPSLQHKVDTHLRFIAKLHQWFPVSDTTIEIASFDTQKMQNPEISGIEYQQGELQGYEIKEYLLEKFGRKCVYCGKSDIPLEIDHIIPKAHGGSDRVSNLTLSCRKCNLKKGPRTAEEFGFPNIQKQAKQSLKATVFMNVVRKRIAKKMGATETFGHITKYHRIQYDLEKSHINDAFVIAGGSTQKRCKPYSVTQTRRNNRCLQRNRKGFRPSIRRKRYKLQPNDLVRYEGKLQRVKGAFNYGKWVRLEDGTNTNVKNVRLVTYGKGLCYA